MVAFLAQVPSLWLVRSSLVLCTVEVMDAFRWWQAGGSLGEAESPIQTG
jgi:hypothetical protein